MAIVLLAPYVDTGFYTLNGPSTDENVYPTSITTYWEALLNNDSSYVLKVEKTGAFGCMCDYPIDFDKNEVDSIISVNFCIVAKLSKAITEPNTSSYVSLNLWTPGSNYNSHRYFLTPYLYPQDTIYNVFKCEAEYSWVNKSIQAWTVDNIPLNHWEGAIIANHIKQNIFITQMYIEVEYTEKNKSSGAILLV